MSTQQDIDLAHEWQRAYQSANLKMAPDIWWERGWFIVDGKKYRRKKLEQMVATLRARCAETSGFSRP